MSFIKYLNESLFVEKKDHLINKIPSLTDDQKQEIIQVFTKFPHKERNIDWNNLNKLTYDDFKTILADVSTTQKTKQVKEKGIEGLTQGKDYIQIPNIPEGKAYIPLNHNASKLLASSYVCNVEGKWCTAQNEPKHWNDYVFKNDIVLVYFIFDNSKYAMAIIYKPDNKKVHLKYELFHQKGNKITSIPNINLDKIKNSKEIEVAKQFIDQNNPLTKPIELAKENYKETKYKDGTDVKLAQTNEEWVQYGKDKEGAYCIKDGEYYYNWYAVQKGLNTPSGWRVPSDFDWDRVDKQITIEQINDMKKRPGGYRGSNGNFNDQSSNGNWWSATEFDASYAFNRYLYSNNTTLYRNDDYKKYGFSVRLLRDLN